MNGGRWRASGGAAGGAVDRAGEEETRKARRLGPRPHFKPTITTSRRNVLTSFLVLSIAMAVYSGDIKADKEKLVKTRGAKASMAAKSDLRGLLAHRSGAAHSAMSPAKKASEPESAPKKVSAKKATAAAAPASKKRKAEDEVAPAVRQTNPRCCSAAFFLARTKILFCPFRAPIAFIHHRLLALARSEAATLIRIRF